MVIVPPSLYPLAVIATAPLTYSARNWTYERLAYEERRHARGIGPQPDPRAIVQRAFDTWMRGSTWAPVGITGEVTARAVAPSDGNG